MRTASSSSAGLPSTAPSTTTEVSAPSTAASPVERATSRAFSSDSLTTCSSGRSPFRGGPSWRFELLTSIGKSSAAISSRRLGELEASTSLIVETASFLSLVAVWSLLVGLASGNYFTLTGRDCFTNAPVRILESARSLSPVRL